MRDESLSVVGSQLTSRFSGMRSIGLEDIELGVFVGNQQVTVGSEEQTIVKTGLPSERRKAAYKSILRLPL